MSANTTTAMRAAANVAVVAAVTAVLLVVRDWGGYLLFHSLVEVFAISVASAVFLVVWTTRDRLDNGYLLWVGIAYLWIGLVDLVHTLAFRGMSLLPVAGSADPATQLWLVARYLQAIALAVAPVFARRRPKPLPLFVTAGAASVTGILAVLLWDVFPTAYTDATGLTTFKIASEWVIIALFALGLFGLYRVRDAFKPATFTLIGWSITLTMASEAAFTLYQDTTGLMNLAGHLLKVGAFFLLYRALVEDALQHPLDVLFRDLNAAERRNRELYEEQRHVTDTLQSGIIEMPASLPGIELASAYRSSSELVRIGGDFYDAFAASDGHISVAIGDVSGKGLDAALLTQTARSTLRAFAAENDLPEEVLARANDALASQLDDSRFVTVLLADLDTRTGALQFACAGHPTPLVCGPASCRAFDVDADPPLGLFPGRAFSASHIDLEPGDLVLVYSDGLTDTRRQDEQFGEDRIREILERNAAAGPTAVAEALIGEVDDFGGGKVTDDVAVLAFRWPGPVQHPDEEAALP